MEEKKIYVILGGTGEYSDHTYWMVCATRSEKEAQKLVNQYSDKARELKLHEFNFDYTVRQKRAKELAKEFPRAVPCDDNPYIDYTGVWYWYEPVELRD